jgi:glycosyltransferase involved in cell wall biosynthesis
LIIINKKIKVVLVRGFDVNKNSASFNRNEAVEKMVQNFYDCVLVKPNCIKYRIPNRLLRGIFMELLFLRVIFTVNNILKDRSYNYIIFLRSTKPTIAFFLWMLCKIRNAKLAIERNEYPSILLKSNTYLISFLYKLFIFSWHYKLFDIIFLMTDELIEFYGKAARRDCIIQKLPMTVDFQRFENLSEKINDSYIFYAGILSEKKDGVESLVHAFYKISKSFPNLCLKLAGPINPNIEVRKIQSLVKMYQLGDKIVFLGNIDRKDIPVYISNAKILVLPRPLSKQAQGGFPTKLGEYLASGKPIIATRVGEIPQYLSETEIFFISPDNIVSEIESTVSFILLNYRVALDIAESGKEAARKSFSIENNQEKIKFAFDKVFK